MARAWRDRLGGALVVVLLAAFALTLVAGEFWRARRPDVMTPAAAECREAYARARTAADTALADRVHPATGVQKGPAEAASCGTLRLTGALTP
jgi:hypothetical protein